GEGELMAHDVPLGCAPDEYDDLISGTCSHLPLLQIMSPSFTTQYPSVEEALLPRCSRLFLGLTPI
ncbi:hypothetical protein ACEWER_26890, partial [Klebsiella pneumoniae]|uniref:hypothetical protein n=1 Tax=Klebsiella pneumoniae TaxID=573 RepID=UPI0035BB5182